MCKLYSSTVPYVGRHPDLGDGESLLADERAEVAARDFPQTGTIVDVGGGRGGLLATILGARPRLQGIVFDLPIVAPLANALFAAEAVGDRARFEGGDFFTAVPASADRYVLVNVLRDWGDADALRILGNVRAAMGRTSRLLVVESSRTSASAIGDLHRMVLFGPARERSTAQLCDLIAGANLAPARTPTNKQGLSIIEATL